MTPAEQTQAAARDDYARRQAGNILRDYELRASYTRLTAFLDNMLQEYAKKQGENTMSTQTTFNASIFEATQAPQSETNRWWRCPNCGTYVAL